MMKRRILAAVTVLCIVTGLIVYPQQTEQVRAAAYGDFEYEVLDDGTAAITKYTGTAANVAIPSRIGEINVSTIGENAFSNCESIQEVSVAYEDDDTGESNPYPHFVIEDGAFLGCTNLQFIGGFYGVSVGARAFFGCTSLIHIGFTSGAGDGLMWEPEIGDEAFMGCVSLKGVDLYEGNHIIGHIGNRAFMGCTSLTSVSSVSYILNIGEQSFSGCENLTSVSIETHDMLNIGSQSFLGCTNLKSASMSSYNALNVGSRAFSGCENLTELELLAETVSIDEGAFEACKALSSMVIPSTMTSIESKMFDGCIGLVDVLIPKNVTDIKENAFNGCVNLREVYYSGVEEQWDSMVREPGNEILSDTNVQIHYNDDDRINNYGYVGSSDGTIMIAKYIGSDTVAEIPSKLFDKEISTVAHAFKNCSDLTRVIISEGIRSIWDSFENCSGLTDIFLPASVEIFNFGKGCSKLENINVADGNKYFTVENGILYYRYSEYEGGFALRFCPRGRKGAFDVIEDVTEIGECAFESCDGLTGITMPNVQYVDSSAFEGCDSLTGITMPNAKVIYDSAFMDCSILTEVIMPNVGFIGGSVFEGCDSLTDIAMPNAECILDSAFKGCVSLTDITAPNVEEIYDSAFEGCSSLTDFVMPEKITGISRCVFKNCTRLKNIELSDQTVRIEDEAFSGCENLTEITIPETVKYIGMNGFAGCSGLKDVYYQGSREQWDKINIAKKGNEPLLNAVLHYKDDPIDIPEEIISPTTGSAKEELERLKSNDILSGIRPYFQNYQLSDEQGDVMESYLFTWLAEINYAYKYSGGSGVKERIMKKAGIDPEGDFTSGTERAVTHVSIETVYGKKNFEITLELGRPDGSGNLYPSYGTMRYEVLEKANVPSGAAAGQMEGISYSSMGSFIESVGRASDDSLRDTYEWQKLSDEMTAGILADKTIAEIIGNKKGSFMDGTFMIYAKPLTVYSKMVKITSGADVDVYVFDMDGNEVGSIENNIPSTKTRTLHSAADRNEACSIENSISGTKVHSVCSAAYRNEARFAENSLSYEQNRQLRADGRSQNVQMYVDGDTKSVYLAGNDYYLQMHGRSSGTMNYEVEEIADAETCREVRFLELQLQQDMEYSGYVFRPLNIDQDLYALRVQNGAVGDTVYAKEDSYQPFFQHVEKLSLSQQNTSLNQNHTVQLQAGLYPLNASNPQLLWKTDDESVITVDGNGLVTAVGAGRATITVMTKDGSFLKQFCVIDVAGGSVPDGGDQTNQPGGSQTGQPGSSGGSSSGGTGGSAGNGGSGSSAGGGTAAGAGNSLVVENIHYVVQFHTNGGMNLSRKTMTLLADDSPGIMPKVQRKDYVFSGWYTQLEGGEQVKGDKPLGEAVTLYARWTKAEAPSKTPSPELEPKKKGKIRVRFRKMSGAAGYQIEYSDSKKFESAETKELKASAGAKTIAGLKAGKKYFVRMRAYSVDSMGNRVYGTYSAVKTVKILG